MEKRGSRVVWDYQGQRGAWGSTERPGCLRMSQRVRPQEGLDAGGSGGPSQPPVRPRGLGSAETPWGVRVCARGSYR